MPVDLEKIRSVVDEICEKASKDPELAARAKKAPVEVLKEHGLSMHEIQANPGIPGDCDSIATSLSGRINIR